MNNEYVIMTVIEPPLIDPIPGEAFQLRLLDLACKNCELHFLKAENVRWLARCEMHQDLNVLQSRRVFREAEPTQQQELFPQETDLAQPVA